MSLLTTPRPTISVFGLVSPEQMGGREGVEENGSRFSRLRACFDGRFGLQGVRPQWHSQAMARANRLSGHGGIFHVTHRCHNREFLLKFACDRNGYRAKLREHLPEFEVALLDYCITCNHVHLLLDAEERMQISGLMRTVAGEFARGYNRRKERMNAFWGDNFHATLVEEGTYLWRCSVLYRAEHGACGRVDHPREWEWVGYHEIMGQRQRYRLLDLERLCWRLRTDDLGEVREESGGSSGRSDRASSSSGENRAGRKAWPWEAQVLWNGSGR